MPRQTCPSVIYPENSASKRIQKTAKWHSSATLQYSIPPPRRNARGKEAFVKRFTLQWRFLNVGVPLLLLLLCSVFAAGQLAANPTSVSFGNVVVGSSVTQSLILTNTSNWSISISQATVSGAAFSLSGLTLPVTLSSGSRAQVTVVYFPQATGTASGNVSFSLTVLTGNSWKRNSSPTATLSVGLSGSGVTPATLSPNPTSDSFGSVQVGSTQSVYQTITNSGSASVSLSQASVTGAGFSISGLTLPTTLSPGQSVSFTASFSPTVTGSVSGSISVLSNASNPNLTIGLSGTGAAQGQLTITPTSANFGTVTVGATSSQTGSISASGSSVTISSGSINSSEFLLSGITFPLTLAAGQSAPVTLTFAPQMSGTASATLSFVSNASSNSTASLTGTGGTTTHSVGLTWSDSGSGVAGYNVYRSGVSGGPYSGINTGLDATTSYTDTAVQAGQTYYYVVTAVGTSGTESAYSSETSATIPSP